MTLSSRHRIQNSRPGGLRPSTLPLGHGGSPQYWLSHVDGEETFFCFFQTAETGNRTTNTGVKGSGANHCPRAPALLKNNENFDNIIFSYEKKMEIKYHTKRQYRRKDRLFTTTLSLFWNIYTSQHVQIEATEWFNDGVSRHSVTRRPVAIFMILGIYNNFPMGMIGRLAIIL